MAFEMNTVPFEPEAPPEHSLEWVPAPPPKRKFHSFLDEFFLKSGLAPDYEFFEDERGQVFIWVNWVKMHAVLGGKRFKLDLPLTRRSTWKCILEQRLAETWGLR